MIFLQRFKKAGCMAAAVALGAGMGVSCHRKESPTEVAPARQATNETALGSTRRAAESSGGNDQTNSAEALTNRAPGLTNGSGFSATTPPPSVDSTNDPAKQAELKQTMEIYNEAVHFFRGDDRPQNRGKAAELFKRAAEKGHPGAEHNLGVMYTEGAGVPKDPEQARQWFTKAAEAGLVEAQFKLASLYAIGLGVKQDWGKAVEWARKAAEQGHPEAQYNLATLYVSGNGVKQDFEQAAVWYRKAAEQGHATAQSNLGVFYASGRGVKQDYVEAVKWLKKAADHGNPTAEFNLGRLYWDGKGVPEDKVEAYKWLTLAANQGDNEAETIRSELGAQMTSGQILEAIRRGTAFARDLTARATAAAKETLAQTNGVPFGIGTEGEKKK